MNGTGTRSDPYVISSTEDLALLSGSGYASYSGSSKYFVLGCDIDFNSASFTPIGDAENPFIGKFNGNFHVISNMTISGDSGFLGFFAYCSGSAVIEKIIFRNCTVTDSGTTGNVGMVVGRVSNPSNFVMNSIETDGCSLSSGGSYTGGVVGVASWNPTGTVEYRNIYVHNGSVVGTRYVGGIAGLGSYNSNNLTVMISHCRIHKEVIYTETASADAYAGGITGSSGYNSTAVTIDSCTVITSAVRASGHAIGGISGCPGTNASLTVTNCRVNNCYIRANGRCVSGIVGWVPNVSIVTVANCSVTRNTIYSSIGQTGGIIGGLQESSDSSQYTIENPVITNNCIYSYNSGYSGGVIGYLDEQTS